MLIDEGHNNFHTISGRFSPFAHALRTVGGFHVSGTSALHNLSHEQILVISGAVSHANKFDWTHPILSAFTEDEVRIIDRFVFRGGSLLLAADHMPFGGAAATLARRFGVHFTNTFVMQQRGEPILFEHDERAIGVLGAHEITKNVRSVATFTGQAFSAASGTPLLIFNAPVPCCLPAKRAWDFANATCTSAEGLLQGLAMQHGRGRAVFLGESGMLTAQVSSTCEPFGFNSHPENLKFILRLMSWLSADGRG